MTNWMKKLALHYEQTRRRHPHENLMILFDIDGTILDMRFMILQVLKSYDTHHATDFFSSLTLDGITVHENQIETLLEMLQIPKKHHDSILAWYRANRWSSDAILGSHQPFTGVMEVIRWFQLQPDTFVGLNTGRPEDIRDDTLCSLNALGREYKTRFRSDLLHMNPYGWEQQVTNCKAAGVDFFRNIGYHVFAVVDNEPDNLDAIARRDPGQEILLLHADTIFESARRVLPAGSVSGRRYDLTDLIPERALPRHIQFVWHGVNDEYNLRQFLASNVRWAELDVRMDPDGDDIILRHDSFAETPLDEEEELVYLRDVLEPIRAHGKSVKLDFKEDGALVDQALDLVKIHAFEDARLWFNGNADLLGEDGFAVLHRAHPSAIFQCPVDHLTHLIPLNPGTVADELDRFCSWGITRFSVRWERERLKEVIDWMDTAGHEMNIYNVPDLEAFLKTVLLMPRSITADFNFPKWHYFGRGSGQRHQHYEYSVTKGPLMI